MHINNYKVAEFVFSIEVPEVEFWHKLSWHYDPFVTYQPAALRISIAVGNDDTADANRYKRVFFDSREQEGVWVDYHVDDCGNSMFELTTPNPQAPVTSLYINRELSEAKILIRPREAVYPSWLNEIATTSAIQLAYMLGTANHDRLMSHSSCIVNEDKAYLFIGRSGTGKSTHSRLWLKNIKDATLLNDDHPIVSLEGDRAIAFGSPWSGKTNCYINSSAPIAAIVRIKQAPYNKIKRLNVVEAYASLSTSFSGLKFVPEFANARHESLEKLIERVPCYQLECLPDDDAARLCYTQVANND